MDQSGNDFSVSRIHREVCTDSFLNVLTKLLFVGLEKCPFSKIISNNQYYLFHLFDNFFCNFTLIFTNLLLN